MNNVHLSVIIPTFNEKDNIVKMIRKIQKLIKTLDYEIIIVDDNSPDSTGTYAKSSFFDDSRIRVLIRKQNCSLGKSIYLGIEKARGNIIVGMDGDGNHNPDDLLSLIDKIGYYDLVICSRFIKGGGMHYKLRFLTSLCVNKIIKIILKSRINDLTSGYYAIKQKKLKNLPLKKIYYGYGDYFIRLVYYAEKKGISVYELPCFFTDRWSGQSKSRLWRMALDYISLSFRLRYL